MKMSSAIAAATMALGSVAGAQSSDPYAVQRIYISGEPGRYAKPDEAQKIMRQYAQCNARYGHDAVRNFLLTPAGARLSDEEYRRVSNPECLGMMHGQLRMPRLQYKGALAEALINRDFPQMRATDFSAVPRLDWTMKDTRGSDATAAAEERYQQLLADQYIGRVGECIVRGNPVGAISVLKSADAASETQAWTVLTPQIASCVKNGETVTFGRADLRSAMAVSYYRLASAAGAIHSQAASR